MEQEREIGEVWKDRDFRAKKPWFVKTFNGTPRYHRKKDAVAVGELFKRELEARREQERMQNVDIHSELVSERCGPVAGDESGT